MISSPSTLCVNCYLYINIIWFQNPRTAFKFPYLQPPLFTAPRVWKLNAMVKIYWRY